MVPSSLGTLHASMRERSPCGQPGPRQRPIASLNQGGTDSEMPARLLAMKRMNAELLSAANANIEILARAVAEAEIVARQAASQEAKADGTRETKAHECECAQLQPSTPGACQAARFRTGAGCATAAMGTRMEQVVQEQEDELLQCSAQLPSRAIDATRVNESSVKEVDREGSQAAGLANMLSTPSPKSEELWERSESEKAQFPKSKGQGPFKCESGIVLEFSKLIRHLQDSAQRVEQEGSVSLREREQQLLDELREAQANSSLLSISSLLEISKSLTERQQ